MDWERYWASHENALFSCQGDGAGVAIEGIEFTRVRRRSVDGQEPEDSYETTVALHLKPRWLEKAIPGLWMLDVRCPWTPPSKRTDWIGNDLGLGLRERLSADGLLLDLWQPPRITAGFEDGYLFYGLDPLLLTNQGFDNIRLTPETPWIDYIVIEWRSRAASHQSEVTDVAAWFAGPATDAHYRALDHLIADLSGEPPWIPDYKGPSIDRVPVDGTEFIGPALGLMLALVAGFSSAWIWLRPISIASGLIGAVAAAVAAIVLSVSVATIRRLRSGWIRTEGFIDRRWSGIGRRGGYFIRVAGIPFEIDPMDHSELGVGDLVTVMSRPENWKVVRVERSLPREEAAGSQ